MTKALAVLEVLARRPDLYRGRGMKAVRALLMPLIQLQQVLSKAAIDAQT
jgi:hypothetical protein